MIRIEVLTPERLVGETEGAEVLVPTVNGIVGIRTGHLPLIAPLKPGEVLVKDADGNDLEHYAVSGGFLEVSENTVRILADTAERADELDELKIQENIARAEQRKADAKDSHELAEATALLEQNFSRLKVAQRKKHHHNHPPI